jgi:hypothetical protein
MPLSLAPLRLLLGGLCIFFAYYLGRSLSARVGGRVTNAQVIRWVLRVLVTGIGTVSAGFDALTLLLLGLAAASTGAGYFAGQRPRKPGEDLVNRMFPKD